MIKDLHHPIPSKTECQSTRKLDRVFIDMNGSRTVAALGCTRCMALFGGEYSRFRQFNFLHHISDTAWALEGFLANRRSNIGKTEIIRMGCRGDSKGRFAHV